MSYEYKVVPAPSRGRKAKGRKTNADRFAFSVEEVLNENAADGWEYLRAELLPSDERTGLTGVSREWRNVLVFRRPLGALARAPEPRTDLHPAPQPAYREHPAPVAEPESETDDFYDEQPDDGTSKAEVTHMDEARLSRTPPAAPSERLSPLERAVQIAKRNDKT